MLKLIPIFLTNGFSFLFTQINVTVPIISKYYRFSQIIPFTILILGILIQFVFLFALLIFIILVNHSNMWLQDEFAETRKIYLFAQNMSNTWFSMVTINVS
jgi:hypothetical protein